MFKVAIVGMPNVGKSTLFNAMIGRNFAIVHDLPGVTRDYKSANCNFFDLEFELIDTAGWEVEDKDLAPQMKEQTRVAIKKADIVLVVFDSTRYISGYEIELVNHIRKVFNNNFEKCIVLLNKSDLSAEIDINRIYKLGFKNYIEVSASCKLGFDSLYTELSKIFQSLEKEKVTLSRKPSEVEDIEDVLKVSHLNRKESDGATYSSKGNFAKNIDVAIVGRPNAGKSTMFNSIIKENRAIVSEVSGTTRDSIGHKIEYNNQTIEFIDTAGLRKRKKITGTIENYSVGGSITSVRRADIVILVLDATLGVDSQELKIAGIAQNEGKPLIVILNKVDLLKNRRASIKNLINEIKSEISDSKELCVIYKSALRDKSYNDLLDRILDLYAKFNMKMRTAKLNRWLSEVQEIHIPPLASNGRRIKLKYITQCATRPPAFKVFCNYPKQLPKSYVRYLQGSFVKDFGMKGIPIRIEITKSQNPYEGRK